MEAICWPLTSLLSVVFTFISQNVYWIMPISLAILLNAENCMVYSSVSQTVVRGPQVVLGFCPCGPFRLNISPKKTEKIKLTWIAYHTLYLRISNRVWKLHTTSVFKLSLPGLTFYKIYYPTYSILNNKRGIFCCKNMFLTLFKAGLMSLIIPRVGWSVEHSD